MPQRLSGCKCLQVVWTSKYQSPSSWNTLARSWRRNQRMYSNSSNVLGVSIGRAKYRQHLAVQYSHSDWPSGRSLRRILTFPNGLSAIAGALGCGGGGA